jgi:hypothetical protein
MTTSNNEESNLPARPEDVADVMLSETASSNALLLFKKGKYTSAGNDVEIGTEFISYPFDAMRGLVRWQDKKVVDRRMGRIRDRFKLTREELPADEDWQPQCVLPLEDPETGTFVAFVSGSVGGRIAIEKLINTAAQMVKSGKGDLTPTIKIGVSNFTSPVYGEVPCPAFEIVNTKTIAEDMDDEIGF